MIQTTLRTLPLGEPIDANLIPIDAMVYRGDVSALSTLRALLIPRLDKTVNTEASYKMLQDVIIDSGLMRSYHNDNKEFIDRFMRETVEVNSPDTIKVYNLCYDDDTDDGHWSKTFWTDLKENFPRVGNCEELEAPKVFCEQNGITAAFYIDKTCRYAYVFIRDLSIRTWHLIQAFIPVLMPWVFETEPLTKQEKDLLTALSLGKTNDYINGLKEIEAALKIKETLLHKQLSTFESGIYKSQLASLEDNIHKLNRQIAEYQDYISDTLKQKDVTNLKIIGLTQKIASAEEVTTDIEDYFKANKFLTLRRATSGQLSFGVVTPMNNFNPDIYEGYVNNPVSVVNTQTYYYDIPWQDGKLLLDGIFLKQNLKLWTRAYLTLDVVNHYIVNNKPVPSEFADDTVPNPHLTYFDCFGNNGRAITQALVDCDIIQALENCVSSTANINVGELPNFRNLMTDLFRSGRATEKAKCIELPNGERVTPKDAIAWLKGETNEQTDND